MSNAWRKLFAASIICYLIEFAVILLTSIFSFSLEVTVAEFQIPWIMARTWSDFLALAPVAQAWAVVITFSLIVPVQSGGFTRTAFERFGSTLVLLIVFTLGFLLAYGIAYPRAVAAYDAEDYSTAHYMATLALALNPDSEEAARVSADSLRRLAESAPDAEETEEAGFFRQKQAAMEELTRGEVIQAYYDFRELAETHRGDPDVARYLAIAREKVSQLSVFKDDVEAALSLPGTGSFVFVNKEDQETRELVAIGKLVRTPSGLFAHKVEVIRFTLDGQLQYHLTSDFGKLMGNSLVLTVLDPDGPNPVIRPVQHFGLSNPQTDNLLELTPTADELWLLAVASGNPAGASIIELVRTGRLLRTYGIATEPVDAELLARLSLPFTFLILSVLTLGFAWRYRSRYLARPPLGTYIIVPFVPLVLVPAYLLVRYAHRILFSALLLWAGLSLSLVLVIVVEGVILTASLLYLALSARE